jgi:hypothetical protein
MTQKGWRVHKAQLRHRNMDLTNFQIHGDFNTLINNGDRLDLHNDYDFTSLHHDVISRTSKIVFHKSDRDGIPKTLPGKLTLMFKNISRIFHKEQHEDYPSDYVEADGQTIDMIGFSYADDEIMQGVTDNFPNKDLPALLFVFVTGRAIKTVADSVKLDSQFDT